MSFIVLDVFFVIAITYSPFPVHKGGVDANPEYSYRLLLQGLHVFLTNDG